jgi:hypothetical protein
MAPSFNSVFEVHELPSYRKRSQRKKAACKPRTAAQEAFARVQAERRLYETAKAQERKAYKKKALSKVDHEFDSYLCGEQQMFSSFNPVPAITSRIDKGLDSMRIAASAVERLATTSETTVAGFKDFFSTNKTKLISQLTLAIATITLSPTIYIVLLEILKLLVQYTSVFDDVFEFVSNIWPAVINMIKWALQPFQSSPQGSIVAGLVGEQQSDFQSFVPTKQFWATSGALAAGVGALIGTTLIAEKKIGVTSIAYDAYRQATKNIMAKKIQDGAEGFCGAVIDAIKASMIALFPEGTFLPVLEKWLHAKKLDIPTFLSEVNAITNPLERDVAFESKETATKLTALVQTAYTIENAIARKEISEDSKQVSLLKDATRRLMTFAVEYQNSHQEKVRDTPFVICIFSAPGVGKSVMTSAIIENLMAKEHGCTVPWNGRTYYRSGADKYHTNYRDQDVYAVDDWGQSRVSSPENSEFRDFISIVSSVPFSPPQAAISDKGRSFRSKLVITTTNNPYPIPTEIVAPQAIYRRRNFVWEMSVLNENEPQHSPLRYGFQRFDSMEKRPLGSVLSFEDAILMMIPVFNKWNDQNQVIKKVGFIPFSRKIEEPQKLGGEPCTSVLLGTEQSGVLQRDIDIPQFQHAALHPGHTQDFFHSERRRNEDNLRSVGAGCMCCGAQVCGGRSSHGAMRCVRNATPNTSEWPMVNCYEAWSYMDELNLERKSFDVFMCWARTIIFYRESNEFAYQEYHVSNFPMDHEDLSNIFYLLWKEEHFGRAQSMWEGDFTFGAFQAWRASDECPQYFPEPAPIQEVDMDEMDWEMNVDQWNEAPILDQEWEPAQGYDLVGNQQSEIEATATENAEVEDARRADEQSILSKIFDSASLTEGQRTALRVVLGLSTLYVGVRAFTAIRNYFKPQQSRVNIISTTTTDQGITQIVETLPPTLRQAAGAILQVVVAELTAGALASVYQSEGGAAAYGEAKTLRARLRQNVKFARPLTQAVQKNLLAAQAASFNDGEVAHLIGEAQGCSDSNGLDLVTNKLGPKSAFTLTRHNAPGEKEGRTKIRGFGVCGRLVCFPAHFLPEVPTVLESTLLVGQRNIPLSVDYSKAVIMKNGDEDMDLALIELDHGVESFIDIRKHFLRESQLKSLNRFKSMLIRHQAEAGGYFSISNYVNTTSIVELGEGPFNYGPSYDKLDKQLLNGFAYNVPTSPGDCGSLLVALDPSLIGRICGVHVGGIVSREMGFSTAITMEVLNDNITKFFPKLTFGTTSLEGLSQLLSNKPIEEQMEKITFIPQGEIELTGMVAPHYAQRFPRGHDIVQSRLFDKVFVHTQEPSVLSPSDPRIDRELAPPDYLSPLQQGGQKYSIPTTPFASDKIDYACKLIYNQLSAYGPTGMEMRLLTEDEVLNGVPSAGYTGMDMSTSPGMPYKNMRPPMSKGKHIFFSCDAETGKYTIDLHTKLHGVNPGGKLLADLNAWESAARNNEDVPLMFNYENLKQETMGLNKIKIGKTRLFSCSPLSVNMLFRKYFGAYIVLANQNCTNLPSAVGINPLGHDWTSLAQRLLSKGDYNIAGDYKEWDGKLLGAVMGAVVTKIINPLYSRAGCPEEDNRVRERLIEYAIHTYTLLGNTLVQKHQGNPSGIPITSDLNSLCNWVYMLVTFAVLHDEHRRNEPKCMVCDEVNPMNANDYLAMTFYGDDHILSVAREARCFFTFNAVRDFFSRHGVTYTDALKRGGVCPDFQTLSEVSYLKRMFVKHESGRYLAPLEIDSIRNQINWVKKSNDPTEALLQNVESAMKEFFMHGRHQYEEAGAQIRAGLEELQQEDLAMSAQAFALPEFSFTQEHQKWLANSF